MMTFRQGNYSIYPKISFLHFCSKIWNTSQKCHPCTGAYNKHIAHNKHDKHIAKRLSDLILLFRFYHINSILF